LPKKASVRKDEHDEKGEMELKTGTLVKGKHRRRFPIQKLLRKKLHQNTENFYCLQKFNT